MDDVELFSVLFMFGKSVFCRLLTTLKRLSI